MYGTVGILTAFLIAMVLCASTSHEYELEEIKRDSESCDLIFYVETQHLWYIR